MKLKPKNVLLIAMTTNAEKKRKYEKLEVQ